jgi:hypothetical protein
MTPEVSDITFSFHSKQCPPSEVEVGGGVCVPIRVLVSASLDEQFMSEAEVGGGVCVPIGVLVSASLDEQFMSEAEESIISIAVPPQPESAYRFHSHNLPVDS